MKSLRKWLGVMLALAVIFIAACSLYRAMLDEKTPLSARIGNYETVFVYVTTMVIDSPEEVALLEKYIIENLKKKAIFKKIVPSSVEPDASTDLRLNTKILDLRKAGILKGGGADIKIEVELVDVKTGATIGVFECKRYTSQSTTKDVIFDVAKRTAEYLKENM